jgi:aminoglycoside adenylyltransferase-like protein
VRRADLTAPAGGITPVFTANGSHFGPGRGPVALVDWTVLAQRGIPVRGPAPAELGLDPEPHRLRAWNHENLDTYWRPWAARFRGLGGARGRLLRPSGTVWAVLGAPRLHCTIATGRIVSKVEAGEYALRALDPRWHRLLDYALARRTGAATGSPAPPPALVADFVDHVVDSAHALP